MISIPNSKMVQERWKTWPSGDRALVFFIWLKQNLVNTLEVFVLSNLHETWCKHLFKVFLIWFYWNIVDTLTVTILGPITMKLGQNICSYAIFAKFENGFSPWKTWKWWNLVFALTVTSSEKIVPIQLKTLPPRRRALFLAWPWWIFLLHCRSHNLLS